MSKDGPLKRVARATRSWRIAWGLAHEPQGGSVHLARAAARRALPGGRVLALERDVDRLLDGWNQHIPQFLSTLAEARKGFAEVDGTQKSLADLERRIMNLSQENALLAKRLDELQAMQAQACQSHQTEAHQTEALQTEAHQNQIQQTETQQAQGQQNRARQTRAHRSL